MKKDKEVRFFAQDINVRNDENAPNEMIVEGYAVVFDSPATHGFTEIIKKGAFDNCDMKDVPLKYNHDDSHLILARTRNNSLQLEVDDKGLKIRAKLMKIFFIQWYFFNPFLMKIQIYSAIDYL